MALPRNKKLTIIIEATIVAFPDSICNESQLWSGASLKVAATCEQGAAKFMISNEGKGAMLQKQSLVIVEDLAIVKEKEIRLEEGAIETIILRATGSTFHAYIDQVPDHPGRSAPIAYVEGCGGINTPGLVNAFPQDDNDQFIAIDCQENIGAFDPNDKAAFPKGYGTEHYIKKNTDIEYKIRFQNTGTDTAFKVVIIDTLSENVDVSTFRVGTSSHDYKLVLRNQEVKFIFNDIQLVDSFKNEPLSHGFITYKIEQKADLADGNQIFNRAGIYFDFNDPIITNTTYHEIGTDFMDIINNTESSTVLLSSQVYPHPMTSQSFIKLDSELQQEVQLRIIDAHGRTIRLQSQYGNLIPIYRDGLVNGMYYYEVRTDGVLLSSGKLVIQ